GPFPKETPLMSAAEISADCVKILLAAGAEVNAQNEAGSTPLMGAVHNDLLDCARILIGAGANPNLRDLNGRHCFTRFLPGMTRCANSFSAPALIRNWLILQE